MSAPSINPVLALVTQTDSLASSFRQLHHETLAPAQSLEHLYHSGQLGEAPLEALLSLLRDKLGNMETCVEEMMNLLYRIDVFFSDRTTQLRAGFDPKEALDHISASVHAYQTELLSKRELLSDFTCESISVPDFVAGWQTLDEVKAGNKQDMDSLADLLAGFG